MKNIFLILFYLYSMYLGILGFGSNKICQKESMYVGKYDQHGKYQVVQTNRICTQKRTQYNCGLEHCASNMSMCDLFIKTKFVSLVFKDFDFLEGKSIKNEIQDIKNCTYTLSVRDVCVNAQECLERTVVRLRNGNIRLVKSGACKCRGRFNYHCGSSLCSIHKKACETFLTAYNQTEIVNLKGCENDTTNL